jgi:colanic acid/amylovoran biosynthesis glycosyltransferase
MKIGYLISEWPGQSHVWAWREIAHLRELGLEVSILSTRRPQTLNIGKHSFVSSAEAETFYVCPMSLRQIIVSLLWALCYCPNGLLSCLWLGCRLPVYHQPAWRSILPLVLPACCLAREIKRRNIQHLHTPMPASSAVLCMMVKRLVGVPFSLTIVANFSHWGGAMREKIAEAEFVALVAHWMVQQLQHEFPDLSAVKYSVARHGVNTEKWKPSSERNCTHSQAKRIFSVGRLTASKGFDTLIQAASIVKRRGFEFQLEIAGEGPERSTLEKLIIDLNLSSEVKLLGSLAEEECLAKMQAADLFALATRDEALGVVFIEALAVEVASIGTLVGGVMETIQNGVNGLLVPPDHVELLADAIVQLLMDDGLRERLGKAGRQTVLENFDSRQGAEVLANLILESYQKNSYQNQQDYVQKTGDRQTMRVRETGF